MDYPIDLSYKTLALGSQIYVRDASGSLIGYFRKEAFNLNDPIQVFTDEGQTNALFSINIGPVVDFSIRYTFADKEGMALGSIKRRGKHSSWRARYDIFDASGSVVMNVVEENSWISFADQLLAEIPIIGFLSAYIFHLAFLFSGPDEKRVARLQKKPAFFEGKFQLTAFRDLSSTEKQLVLLSGLMMAFLEGHRG